MEVTSASGIYNIRDFAAVSDRNIGKYTSYSKGHRSMFRGRRRYYLCSGRHFPYWSCDFKKAM